MVHRTVGCGNCKKRKIKCDLASPGCQRCQRVGKACPGYPNQWDLTFHSENAVVYAKAHRKQKSSTKELDSFWLYPPLPRNVLSDDVQLHATCLFFHDYTVNSCADICEGWLDYLPDLYGRYSENSSLRDAVLAVAYANMAKRTERKDLELTAAVSYHSSLKMVKSAISSPQLATSDFNMTAVILLGVYECINNAITYEVPMQHTNGLAGLAELRGSSLLMLGKGPNLLQIACCQVNRRNIEFSLLPSSADERLNKLLDPASLSSRTAISMFKVSVYYANTYRDIQSGISHRIWNAFVLESFEELELEARQWIEDARISFPYEIIPGTARDRPNSVFSFNTEYHIYRGFWSESLWNKHRAGIITLNQALLARLDAAKASDPPKDLETPKIIELRYRATLTIQLMIHDIFASIPYSLGDVFSLYSTASPPKSVGGYFLVWCLTVILRCPVASSEQLTYARATLIRIGKQCGLSYAVKSAQNYMVPDKT